MQEHCSTPWFKVTKSFSTEFSVNLLIQNIHIYVGEDRSRKKYAFHMNWEVTRLMTHSFGRDINFSLGPDSGKIQYAAQICCYRVITALEEHSCQPPSFSIQFRQSLVILGPGLYRLWSYGQKTLNQLEILGSRWAGYDGPHSLCGWGDASQCSNSEGPSIKPCADQLSGDKCVNE